MNLLTRLLPVFLILVAITPARAVEVQRVISPGGIEAWLVQDSNVPLLSVQFSFEGAGSASDPKGKSGLANLLSGLLDEGAGELDSQAFQGELSNKSITLSYSASKDHLSGTLKTLTKRQDRAFELLRLSLTQPRFDAEPVSRIRQQIITGLRRAEKDPQTQASLAFFKAAFPDHPYGRDGDGTEASVSALTVADLKHHVAHGLAKDNLKIGVAGDITPEALGQLIDIAFGGLPDKSDLPTVPNVTFAGKGLQVIEKPIPQSTVILGQTGIDRNDPDFYTAYVANYILGGGGFSSRLTEEVREKRGLAYSVYSYLVSYHHSSMMLGGVGTDNARVAESIDLIRAEWQRLAEDGVTDEELADAKSYLTGAFPLRFTRSDGIASMLLGMQEDDLGIDFLDKRNSYVEAVTKEGIARVAKQLWQADDLFIVVVGQPEGLDG